MSNIPTNYIKGPYKPGLFFDSKNTNFLRDFLTRLEISAYCAAIGCNMPDIYWVNEKPLRKLFEYSNKGGRSKIAEQFKFNII
jgi:hypothetical protein